MTSAITSSIVTSRRLPVTVSAPLVCGAALAAKRRGKGGLAVAFCGDGASNQGTVFEAMNLATVWKLPVVFVCENNLYAMGTALTRSESETDIHRKAESYRVPAEVVDGMDPVFLEKHWATLPNLAKLSKLSKHLR